MSDSLKKDYFRPLSATWIDKRTTCIKLAKASSWLLEKGSLSQKIRAMTQSYTVSILNIAQKGYWPPCVDTPCFFKKEQLLVRRTVLLYADQQAWIYAQSYFPILLWEHEFADLHHGVLGDRLFSTDSCIRSILKVGNFYHSLANNPLLHDTFEHQTLIWGRRSWFSFKKSRVMLDEIFLPDSPVYQQT